VHPQLRLLTPDELAAHLGVPPRTVRDWRRTPGLGPQPTRVGRHVRYTPADVAAWLLAQRQAGWPDLAATGEQRHEFAQP
jgi:excisionase family DNA binding protein